MKEKSEADPIFKNFNSMIQTQFQTKIKVFRTNNFRDYFNSILGEYLVSNGIVHQSSCVDTPQPNGAAERRKKKRQLLEVARSIMFTIMRILTATYLINRMPSRVLKFQTPCQTLILSHPDNRIISSLKLKIRGRSTLVLVHEQYRSKLNAKAIKCIFQRRKHSG